MGQTPELLLDGYYQRNMRQMDQKFQRQWDEVNKRAPQIGQRRQYEMLNEIAANEEAEMGKFHNMMTERMEQLKLADRLGKQGGFDVTEAKWRMVLGPEMEAAMFPRQGASAIDQYSTLDVYKNRIRGDAEDFVVEEAGKIKRWWLPSFLESTRPTKAYVRTYDESAKGAVSFEGKKGFYTPATTQGLQRMGAIRNELRGIDAIQQDLLGSPEIATRVRSAMTRRLRKGGDLTDKIKSSMPAPKSAPKAPQGQQAEPTAEQLMGVAKSAKKGSAERKQAYEQGVRLGYWE